MDVKKIRYSVTEFFHNEAEMISNEEILKVVLSNNHEQEIFPCIRSNSDRRIQIIPKCTNNSELKNGTRSEVAHCSDISKDPVQYIGLLNINCIHLKLAKKRILFFFGLYLPDEFYAKMRSAVGQRFQGTTQNSLIVMRSSVTDMENIDDGYDNSNNNLENDDRKTLRIKEAKV
ncbi:hypothetical protein RhiirA5_377287 [Rhizophagus irregularis]|uniref:Uncharacterized protein n=1 Tax=Rhizophagus irregularis TaxID=588596 RepID=A0A2N0PJY0_9GLOM|nr:hypothetical protein RhiirA5_377287 [Rhizophagus irregularis]